MTLIETDMTSSARIATRPTVLMCRPDHFTVRYRINPWMHPQLPTDTGLAVRQWEQLYGTYLDLGFEVHLIDPVPGLPDMVYAANGGFTMDGIAYGARFQYSQRAPEGPLYLEWLAAYGFRPHEPAQVNEGEGDFLPVGDVILAGTGFRSSAASHDELRAVFGREVLSLRLVDPRFYHLDTAVAVLNPSGGPDAIAYLPEAFDAASRAALAERFPDAIQVGRRDAGVLGLNSFSDGRHVVIAAAAEDFGRQLRDRGYVPHPVDLSELLLGGGGVKCCTLELRK